MEITVSEAVASLVQSLREHQLLVGPQLDEVTNNLSLRFRDVRPLAHELVQRGWLTPFQVNQLMAGRGRNLLIGSYILLERLGEGATGQVFKARHVHMQRTVAVKVIRFQMLTDPEIVQRFYREIQVISQLDHPNIVHAYDAGPFASTHFLAMEYVEGIDLGQLVKQRGPLPVATACQFIRQTALGLQHAHERGLVHRDIKPSNLLLTNNADSRSTLTQDLKAVIKILDLGLARLPRTADNEASVTLTLAGRGMMGTPDYMAPEQALDFHTADIRADLYSVGCTFFYLLTGQVPFPGDTLAQKLMKHQQLEPPPLSRFRNDVPANVDALLRRLLAKRPDDRFPTPQTVADALGALSGIVPTAPLLRADDRTLIDPRAAVPEAAIVASSTRVSPSWVRRHRWLLFNSAAGVLLLLLVAGFAMLLLRGRSAAPRTDPIAGDATLTEEPSLAALRPLVARYARITDGGSDDPESLRLDLLAFQREHPGSGGAQRASQLLKELPSPLDRLGDKAFPAEQRRSWQPRELVAVLGDHRGRTWADPSSLTVSPDGKLLAVGCSDGSIALFDADTLVDRAVLKGHTAVVFSVTFSADSQTLLSTAADYTARLWSMGGQPKQVASLTLGASYVNHAAFHPGGKLIAIASADGAVHLWDQVDGEWKERTALKGHVDWAQRVAFSPDGKMLVSGAGDGTLRQWEVTEKEIISRATVKGHTGSISVVAFSASGEMLVTGSADRSVRLWDMANKGKPTRVLSYDQRVGSASLAADGKTLAVTFANGAVIHLWGLADEAPKNRGLLSAHQGEANAVAFAPNSKTLFSIGHDRKVRVWEITPTTQQQKLVVPGPDEGLGWSNYLMPSLDGHTLAIRGRLDGTVQLWSVADGGLREQIRLGSPPTFTVAPEFTPDGKFLAAAQGANVVVWELGDKPRAIPLPLVHGNRIIGLAPTPDGRGLASAGAGEPVVRLWDMTARPAPKELAGVKLKEAGVTVVSFTYMPDGKTLAVLGSDKQVTLWDVAQATPQPKMVLGPLGETPAAVGALPDGRTLLTIESKEGKVSLWEIRAGKAVRGHVLAGGPATTAQSVSVSLDGRLAAISGSGTEPLTLWDLATGKKTRSWSLPGPVQSVNFSSDGRHLLTANANGTGYILRLSTPVVPLRK